MGSQTQVVRGQERYKVPIKGYLLLIVFVLAIAWSCRGLFEFAGGGRRVVVPTPTLVRVSQGPTPMPRVRLGCFESIILGGWGSVMVCSPTPTPPGASRGGAPDLPLESGP